MSLEPFLPIHALLLILLAASAHATWNFLAKRSADKPHLIWFSSAIEVLLLAPIATWILAGQHPGPRTIPFLIATGILHVMYTECLLRGYRAGDFTVVYPLARGSAPLLSFFGAIFFLHEHTSAVAVLGAMLITVGILLSFGGFSTLRKASSHASLFWGAATGTIIASYTVVDGYSVTRLLIAPLLVEYAGNLFRAIVLSGQAWRDRAALRSEFGQCWTEALGIAVLTPVGYVLALSAMRIAPVSRVAPVREMSMMIGMYLGARFLRERHMMRRMTGAALVACGVAALALG